MPSGFNDAGSAPHRAASGWTAVVRTQKAANSGRNGRRRPAGASTAVPAMPADIPRHGAARHCHHTNRRQRNSENKIFHTITPGNEVCDNRPITRQPAGKPARGLGPATGEGVANNAKPCAHGGRGGRGWPAGPGPAGSARPADSAGHGAAAQRHHANRYQRDTEDQIFHAAAPSARGH